MGSVTVKVGKVDSIAYTNNGFGNQWTTIDGVRYATYWDARKANWKVGDFVRFRSSERPLVHGQPAIPHADNIDKLKDNETAYRGHLITALAEGDFEVAEANGLYIDDGFESVAACQAVIDLFDDGAASA